MGMFDWYEPSGALSCPVCSAELSEWQGKDGPCALFVWQQGFTVPVDQNVVEKCQMPADLRDLERLPTEFSIYSDDCLYSNLIEAECRTEARIRISTEIVTAETAVQGKYEIQGDFYNRLRRLQGR